MCGIAGVFGSFQDADLDSMLECIQHRGPDDSGTFVDPDAPLKMGMRRLSIIDLDTGGQPIYNEDETVAVVFNGEIYNYQSLRQSLEQGGLTFQSNTDTEVVLNLYKVEGAAALQQLNGFFAFAIYDKERQHLFLARDRFGIKPLYYFSNN
jgi:asparagine synthase (glutamine-hydrolysing)